MGTRSIAVVTGRHTQDGKLKETIRLYRHWDGSPDAMLATIAAAIPSPSTSRPAGRTGGGRCTRKSSR